MLSVAKVAPEGRSLSRPCHRLLLFDGMFLVGRNVMSRSKPRVPSIFVGDRFTNRLGCEAVVVKYESSTRITVKFLDDFGYELITKADSLRNSTFKNLFHPVVCGVGYLGVGEFTHSSGGKVTVAYRRWMDMLTRCYTNGPGYLEAYIGCTVAPEWHNFQNFAEWHSKQKIVGSMQLDKDILRKGNRIYSPDNCRLIPTEINKAMTGGKINKESGLPTGVVHHQGRFTAQMSTYGRHRYLGVFDIVEEAFIAYKAAKELHIRELAEKYKEVIAPEIYEAMMNWEVLITD